MSPVSFSQGRYSMDLMKKRGKVLIFNSVPVSRSRLPKSKKPEKKSSPSLLLFVFVPSMSMRNKLMPVCVFDLDGA